MEKSNFQMNNQTKNAQFAIHEKKDEKCIKLNIYFISNPGSD